MAAAGLRPLCLKRPTQACRKDTVLKEAGKEAGVAGVTHQMLRRTCSTCMAQITSVKDVQAHLRHTNAKTTLEHYIKSVPESVRVAVESLDHLLKSKPGAVKNRQAN